MSALPCGRAGGRSPACLPACRGWRPLYEKKRGRRKKLHRNRIQSYPSGSSIHLSPDSWSVIGIALCIIESLLSNKSERKYGGGGVDNKNNPVIKFVSLFPRESRPRVRLLAQRNGSLSFFSDDPSACIGRTARVGLPQIVWPCNLHHNIVILQQRVP